MTPQELKASILQLAIQGKLVEQRTEEGTADAFRQQLLSERERLIKAKLIKKEREVLEQDEPPFDIPENWGWIRVGDCISNRAGLAYSKGDLDIKGDSMIRVLRGGNIGDMKYSLKPDDVLIASQFVPSELLLKQNMLITPAVTSLEHVGKVGRIDKDLDDAVVGGFVLMLTPHISNDTFSQYLLYAFSSKYFRDCCRGIVNKSGQAFYNLSREKLMNLYIPLPPLAEQKRIVAKIVELLPYIDRYDQAWSRLEDFNRRFPVDMQKSILQMAIQGKLVEQRPEEGTATNLKKSLLRKKSELVDSGKVLKKTATTPFLESDDLFDIPESWEWVQLSDVSIIQEGAGIRKWQYRDSGTQILCVTNILEGSIDLEKKRLYISTEEYLEKYQHLTLAKGDIVTSCSGGSWGKVSFFDCDETLMLNTSTLRMRFFGDMADNTYLYYVCKSPFFKRQLELQLSGMQPNFGYAHYSRIVFPLPPLAEQKRIVAKLEEILPLCDRLK